jgi:hypothetical protein
MNAYLSTQSIWAMFRQNSMQCLRASYNVSEFDDLELLSVYRHVGASYHRIRNSGVKGRRSDELYCP